MIPSSFFFLRSKGSSLFLAVILALGALGALAPSAVQASGPASPTFDGSSFYVNTYSDDANATDCSGNAATNNCSLRGAISKANNAPGAISIYLQSGGYALYGEPSDDANKGGDLDITKFGGSITIIGDSLSTTTIDARGGDRIFDVFDTGSPTRLNLKNLALVNGNSNPYNDGGSIRTYGTLSLDTVLISRSFGRLGGAIYMRNSAYGQKLIINRSTITGATATLDGGAIYADNGTTTIANSTFDHNKATGVMGAYFKNDNAGRGGAIYNNASLTVTASTFAYNSAKVDGGAILNYAFMGAYTTTYINSSTFKSNSTAVANVATPNGSASTSAITTIANSILASSTETENCVNKADDHGYAAFVNGGSNLDTGVSCGFSGSGSIFGQNPLLGDLSDNGGPTNTIPIYDESPAINMGNPATCAMRDQRGLFAEVRCDIGAYEANAGPVIIPATIGKGIQRLQVTVLNQMGNPLVGWLVTFDPSISIPLSAFSATTNDLGIAAITADSSALSSDTLITVRSGSATTWFRGSSSGLSPYFRDGLPNTGFAPGEHSVLPLQPADKAFHSEADLSLQIPKLDLSLPVVGIPKDGDNWDISWLSRQAGYLEGTAFPSFQGNSVLTSHVYLADGTPGPFVHLNTLIYGDKIRIQAYGTTFTYEVRSVRSVSPGDTSVMAHKDAPWITLLTCQDFDPASHSYLKRLAVSAVLVSSSSP